jgi:two-component system, cell cycle sensor histidine kinase and response regulator CckA
MLTIPPPTSKWRRRSRDEGRTMGATRILVVEPDGVIATDLEERLKKMGHTVTATAASGEQALDAAQRTQPDLVFMDIVLPGPLTGIETARRLRKARDVPVVYLTSDADAAAVKNATGTEPFGYILKPFDERELSAAIQFTLYRHRMGAKLRKVERWLATTLSSIGDAVIATDRHGCVSLINAVAQRLTGWAEEEAVGRPFDEVFRVIDGDTRKPILDLIDRALLDGFSIGMDENVLLQSRSGIELPVDDSIAPIRDEADQVTGVVIVFRDGTERRFAEQAVQALNQQLEHRVQERTAQLEAANRALAAFSGSVSHDLRAPLRTVSSYSNMLSERYANVLDVEGRRFLEIIQTKSAQMGRMIDDFMRLSRLRQAPLRVAPLDIDTMLREVVADLAQEHATAHRIVIDPLPGFEGDEGLIRQVWVNVLGNALKFTAKREHPHIKVTAEESDGMVHFHVADDGAGFDMTYAGGLFRPFHRLHSESDYEGNGIGLATVAGVIDRHGGRLRAEGKIDEGATFHFSVPKRHERGTSEG